MSQEAGRAQSPALSGSEADAVREVGSILMGAAATAVSELVNQRVDVSVPTLRQVGWEELGRLYPYPCFLVQVGFRQGFTGEGQLVLAEPDARRVAQLLLQESAGSPGEEEGSTAGSVGEGLTEMESSALAEAMNQMMGASATALSTLLGQRVTIVPPRCSRVEEGKLVAAVQATLGEAADEKMLVVLCRFRLQKGPSFNMGLILPPALGRSMVADLLQPAEAGEPTGVLSSGADLVAAEVVPTASSPPPVAAARGSSPESERPGEAPTHQESAEVVHSQRVPEEAAGAAKTGRLRTHRPRQKRASEKKGSAARRTPASQPEAPPSELQPGVGLGNLSIGLIRSVPVQLEVRVGSVGLSLHRMLHLDVGGVVVFGQSAREPVEVLANGRLVAYGQVVEVEGNYAVRITQLATSQERLAALRHSG